MGLFGGIITNAMGGAGQAGEAALTQQDKVWGQQQLQEQQAQLETTKAQSLIDYQNQANDQQRDQTIGRINVAKQPVIQSQMAQQYAPSDAAVADAAAGNTDGPLSSDQLAAIAQSKQQTAAALQNDLGVAVQAGYQTGDLGVKEAASIVGAQGAARIAVDAQARTQQFQAALETQRENAADARAQAQISATADLQDKRIQAEMNKGGGGSDFGSTIMNGYMRQAQQNQDAIGKVYKDIGSNGIRPTLADGKTPNPAYVSKILEITSLKNANELLYVKHDHIGNQLAVQLGLSLPPSVRPPSAPPSALPPFNPAAFTK